MPPMHEGTDDSSPQEGILDSPGVALLVGPARSGKSTLVRELYRRTADEIGRARCVVVVPNRPSVEAMRDALLDASATGVILQPLVMTFAALGERILSSAGAGGRFVNAFGRRLLLARVVARLNDEGRLGPLSAVADTPGLVASLDRTVAELKAAAVHPEQLAAAVAPRDAKSAAVLAVYEAYQQCLQEGGAYDLEGRMWRTRDVLADAARDDAPAPGMDGIVAVAADGFTDFTPTQLEILALLSRRVRTTLVTLCHDSDGRRRLWRWTGRTLERLQRAFGEGAAEVEAQPRASALQPAWRRVFRPPTDQAADTPPEGLRLIASAGTDREVAAVARRVKKLLLAGAGPGSVAVLARSMRAYAPTIERVFRDYDIPVAGAPRALTDSPIVRFALDAAGLAPLFSFRDVTKVVNSSYFVPDALGPFGPDEVAAVRHVVREGNVLEGRDAYRAAAERIARYLSRDGCNAPGDDGDDAPSDRAPAFAPETILSAADMLDALFELAGAVGGAGDVPAFVGALALRRAATLLQDDELVARDLSAIDRLCAVTSADACGDLPLAAVADALSAVTCPAPRGESLVEVLDVLDARAMRFDHVFLLGLSEGQFPARQVETALVRHAEREAWRRRGVDLDRREDLADREMLLFYLAASRAERTLTLSFLESGSAGETAQAGPFLLSLLDGFGGLEGLDSAGLVEHVLPGSFVVPEKAVASASEAVNAAVTGAFADSEPPAAAAGRWSLANRPDAVRRACRGIFVDWRRHRHGPCDQYDGRLTDAELLARLGERFPAKTVFSAGMLGAYGQCPWQFFAAELLRLAPAEEPSRRLKPVSIGLFAHDVLFRTLSDLRGDGARPLHVAQVSPERIDAAFDAAVQAASARIERGPIASQALWQAQKRRVARSLRQYLRDQHDANAAEQMHFELGFALSSRRVGALDPASTPEPVVLDTPAGPVRLSGKIDRVDALDEDDARLFVVDYKTGRPPARADIDAGRNVQLQIYAAAVEQMLNRPCAGGAFHAVVAGGERHFSTLKTPRGEKRDFDQRRRDAAETVGRFVAGMAAGAFDVTPTHKCPSYCPFRQICHYSPVRAELKRPPAEGAP
jgi:ATP-dependent helicase/nuclease subunit B